MSSHSSSEASASRISGKPGGSGTAHANADFARAAGPVELSAEGLHELAVQSFRIGNRGRLSLCESLRVLSETRLFLELGFPSICAYANAFFQLRRAEAYEYVRVANALVELTVLREAFGQGEIGWSALKSVTRVASVDSQDTWIDFARNNGIERTLAEARDALRRGRDKPRDSSFGLPNLDQKLVLRFARSDMEKVRAWIDSACASVAEKTGAEGISVEQAILFLCEKGMAPAEDADGRSAPSNVQVVYQRCPECRRSRMGTREGFVEVAPEEVERYEGCAAAVVIDGPTTPESPGRGTPPKMRRQILAREAGRCANPRCRNKADHCHHIKWQSEGGKTCLANEVGVCATCHALVHAGLLHVSGDANGELLWSPVATGESLRRSSEADRSAAGKLPVLQFRSKAKQGGESHDQTGESAIADSPHRPREEDSDGTAHRGLNLDDLAHGLMRLGVAAARSRQLVVAAVEGLPPSEMTEANVLRRALAAI